MLDPGTVGLATAVFVASSVECVEAFTIVLAVGMTRSWKSTIVGSILALLALSMIVAVAGVGLRNTISQSLLQLIIGALLLVFGLQWLRKAILRESGLMAKHDEQSIYRRGQEEARQASQPMRGGLDWFAFVVSFKGVFLEGLEVVFIVITFGLSASLRNPHSMFIASMGALAAFVLVLIAGVIVHKPLSSVPENLLKFAVAVLLCTFGTFWSTEGLGYFTASGESLEWPGGEWALLGVLVAWIIVSSLSVRALRRLYPVGAAVPAVTGAEK
jgi:uncharacterized membrane protein